MIPPPPPSGAGIPPSDTERRLIGTLDVGTFPRLLLELVEERATGWLRVERDGVARILYFLNGLLVFAESNLIDETLGRVLLSEGVIDEAQLEAARARCAADGLRLGEALIAAGWITRERLYAALRAQVRERALACFEWWGARFSFETEPHGLERDLIFPLNPIALTLEATQRARTAASLEAALIEHAQDELCLSPRAAGVSVYLEQLHEGLFGRLCQGGGPCALRDDLGWAKHRVGALLESLEALSLLRWGLGAAPTLSSVPALAVARRPRLDVEVAAPHPNPKPGAGVAPAMSEARIGRVRPELDAMRSAEEARAALRRGAYARATSLLRLAASGAPNEPRHRSLLSWSALLAAEDEAAVRAAERALMTAVERAPHLPINQDLLSRLYLLRERGAH